MSCLLSIAHVSECTASRSEVEGILHVTLCREAHDSRTETVVAGFTIALFRFRPPAFRYAGSPVVCESVGEYQCAAVFAGFGQVGAVAAFCEHEGVDAICLDVHLRIVGLPVGADVRLLRVLVFRGHNLFSLQGVEWQGESGGVIVGRGVDNHHRHRLPVV